jgi:hypothetical protein
MSLSRKDFFKKACLTGACVCGFGPLVFASDNSDLPSAPSEEEDRRLTLVQEYLGGLLINMQDNLDSEENRKIIKQLAQVHYKELKMDEFLKPYENNLPGFIDLLEKEWGWKVTYDESTKVIIADENKSYCVCPMINQKAGIKAAALCYCSEGFAEAMFSKVAGHKVNAKVISSIHRGNDRCKYQIEMG